MMYKISTKLLLSLVSICVVAAIIATLYMSGVTHFFTLESLQCHARELMLFTQRYYWLSVFVYISIFVGAVLLFLPIVTLLMITGGFLFGPWEGALYSVLGATLGACLAFLFVRVVIGPWVSKYEERLVSINLFIAKHGFYALLLLRMSHLVPFFLLNIAAALMPVSGFAFGVATLLGVIPGALLFSWTGQYLCSIHSIWDVISFKMITVAACASAIILVMLACVRWFFKRHTSVPLSK